MGNIASSKKKITITLDDEVYFNIKNKDVNVSKIVNDYLRGYLQLGDNIRPSDLILKEIEKQEKEIIRKKAELELAKSKEKKIYDEQREKAVRMDKALKSARVMDFD